MLPRRHAAAALSFVRGIVDEKATLYQQQFAEIEEYAQSRAGKPVNTGSGDTGETKFCPIILRCAPFYQVGGQYD
jgi:hypothetical protein